MALRQKLLNFIQNVMCLVFWFVKKVKISDRVKEEVELFVASYPYFNEMLVVEELYREVVLNTDQKQIIVNGELDRIRSESYPGPWKILRRMGIEFLMQKL
ncbi:hypothetical protein KIW84_034709 [Lathyrus oleraceus]|uniref:Uncharacterized protein n=1 Tax=Pisum sativum TaxID=3888 RepID=A0A9D4Y049_PEA|nr:hypothetical protein KIW84_034709 [Pisum sativum]